MKRKPQKKFNIIPKTNKKQQKQTTSTKDEKTNWIEPQETHAVNISGKSEITPHHAKLRFNWLWGFCAIYFFPLVGGFWWYFFCFSHFCFFSIGFGILVNLVMIWLKSLSGNFPFSWIPSLLGFWYLTFGFHISLSFATFQVVCLLLGIIQSHKNEAISLEA